uniref:Myb/SANT-like DNA-binding domain-containing protein n=1 Tax=Xiphophorus couchianus TaxID=32473 RepID=A0A3B5MCN9_9TELE
NNFSFYEEDGVHGGVKEAFRSKPRFSYTEVKLLLDEVKKNRHILLKKFNRGVSVDAKKQKWTEITDRINGLGENHREVGPSIMKKWADLKCDGKRRLLALRGPNGSNLRKKRLGPVERMVHRILMMSPSREINFYNICVFNVPINLFENGPEGKGVSSSSPACVGSAELLAGSLTFDLCSSWRIRPVFTYSRTHQNQNQKSCSLPPGGAAPSSSSSSSAAAGGPPPAPSLPSRPSPSRLSSQSLQQQRAGRLLLGSVSRSLEVLTRSVQLLVENQQEFVQESLQLQRDAVDVLRDFSETALRMLRDKTSSGPPGPDQNHQQNHQQNPPTGSQQQHPASWF